MKAFIIYLPERPHSVEFADVMKQQLIAYDIDAELFAGTNADAGARRVAKSQRKPYPFGIKNHTLNQLELKSLIRPEKWEEFCTDYRFDISQKHRLHGAELGKSGLPGVIGCFYSHYDLWKHCSQLDEPIMIFEDDVKFFRGFIPVQWEEVLILSLGKTSFERSPYREYLECPSSNPQPMPWRAYSMPGASGYAITPNAARKLIKKYNRYYCPADNAINQHVVTIQIHNYLMGRNTLPEEGNISMTRFKSKTKASDE